MTEESREKAELSPVASPPGWVLASQWGLNLTVLTCVFGYAGYWVGERLGSMAASFFLMVLGIIIGFAAGLYRMIKATEKLGKRGSGQESDNGSGSGS